MQNIVRGGQLLLTSHISPCISKELLAKIVCGAHAKTVTEINLLFTFRDIIFGGDKRQPEILSVFTG